MSQPPPDRNALLGLFAVRIELLGPEALAEAVRAWERDASKPLGQFLVAHGLLQEGELALLEPLVDNCLKRQAQGAPIDANLPTKSTAVSVTRTLEGAPPPPQAVSPSSPSDGTTSSSGPSRYRVLRPHAKGGLGEVFVALD